MKIYLRVLLIAFAFSFALGILSNALWFTMRFFPTDNQAVATAAKVFGVLSTIISPLLLFVTFYFIGKKPETKGEFYSHLLSFFLGNWIGLGVGSFIGTVSTMYSTPFDFMVYVLLSNLGGNLFPYSFFVGFSALAISYIIKKNR